MKYCNVLWNAHYTTSSKFHFTRLALFSLSAFFGEDNVKVVVVVPYFCERKRLLEIHFTVWPCYFLYDWSEFYIILSLSYFLLLGLFARPFCNVSTEYVA